MRLWLWRKKERPHKRKPDVGKRRKSKANIGKSLEKKRKLQRRKQRFSQLVRVFSKYWLFFAVIFVLVIMLVIGLIFSHILSNTDTFVLKQINVSGNEEITAKEVKHSLRKYNDKSLYSFSSTRIEAHLQKEFPYLRNVYVRKIIPSKLEINIEERFPIFAYVNLAGAYLIDGERMVVNVLEQEETESLTEQQLRILSGFGDPNSDVVKERYLLQQQDEEEDFDEEEFKWSEVEVEKKRSVLEQIRQELEVLVNQRTEEYKQLVMQEQAGIDVVRSTSAITYNIGDKFNQTKFEFVNKIFSSLKQEELTVEQIFWQTNFNVSVQLENGPKLLFTSIRNTDKQLRSLQAFRKAQDISRVQEIDLRGDLVSVR